MIQVRLRRDAEERILALDCRGHAHFSEPGEDIVCAGVSAVIGSLALGLTEVARLPVRPEAGDGHFQVLRPEALTSEQASQWRLLTETTARALLQLQAVYPGFLEVRSEGPG